MKKKVEMKISYIYIKKWNICMYTEHKILCLLENNENIQQKEMFNNKKA